MVEGETQRWIGTRVGLIHTGVRYTYIQEGQTCNSHILDMIYSVTPLFLSSPPDT